MTETQTNLLLKIAEIRELIRRAEKEGALIKIEYSSLKHESLYYHIQTNTQPPAKREQDKSEG